MARNEDHRHVRRIPWRVPARGRASGRQCDLAEADSARCSAGRGPAGAPLEMAKTCLTNPGAGLARMEAFEIVARISGFTPARCAKLYRRVIADANNR